MLELHTIPQALLTVLPRPLMKTHTRRTQPTVLSFPLRFFVVARFDEE
jgi:hypothetical protein